MLFIYIFFNQRQKKSIISEQLSKKGPYKNSNYYNICKTNIQVQIFFFKYGNMIKKKICLHYSKEEYKNRFKIM